MQYEEDAFNALKVSVHLAAHRARGSAHRL